LVVKELADTLSVGLFDFDPPPRYNIAPTQLLAAVRARADAGRQELVPLKWGLIPTWSKDPRSVRACSTHGPRRLTTGLKSSRQTGPIP
jgi:putative SOS response-associated peptidase YedK